MFSRHAIDGLFSWLETAGLSQRSRRRRKGGLLIDTAPACEFLEARELLAAHILLDSAREFSGNNDHVTIPDAETPTATTALTLHAEIRPDSLSRQAIVTQYDNRESSFYFGIEQGGGLRFGVYGNGHHQVVDTDASVIVGDEWHSVLATYSVDTGMHVYVNDTEVSVSPISSSTTIESIHNSSGAIRLGAAIFSSGAISVPYSGQMKNVWMAPDAVAPSRGVVEGAGDAVEKLAVSTATAAQSDPQLRSSEAIAFEQDQIEARFNPKIADLEESLREAESRLASVQESLSAAQQTLDSLTPQTELLAEQIPEIEPHVGFTSSNRGGYWVQTFHAQFRSPLDETYVEAMLFANGGQRTLFRRLYHHDGGTSRGSLKIQVPTNILDGRWGRVEILTWRTAQKQVRLGRVYASVKWDQTRIPNNQRWVPMDTDPHIEVELRSIQALLREAHQAKVEALSQTQQLSMEIRDLTTTLDEERTLKDDALADAKNPIPYGKMFVSISQGGYDGRAHIRYRNPAEQSYLEAFIWASNTREHGRPFYKATLQHEYGVRSAGTSFALPKHNLRSRFGTLDVNLEIILWGSPEKQHQLGRVVGSISEYRHENDRIRLSTHQLSWEVEQQGRLLQNAIVPNVSVLGIRGPNILLHVQSPTDETSVGFDRGGLLSSDQQFHAAGTEGYTTVITMPGNAATGIRTLTLSDRHTVLDTIQLHWHAGRRELSLVDDADYWSGQTSPLGLDSESAAADELFIVESVYAHSLQYLAFRQLEQIEQLTVQRSTARLRQVQNMELFWQSPLPLTNDDVLEAFYARNPQYSHENFDAYITQLWNEGGRNDQRGKIEDRINRRIRDLRAGLGDAQGAYNAIMQDVYAAAIGVYVGVLQGEPEGPLIHNVRVQLGRLDRGFRLNSLWENGIERPTHAQVMQVARDHFNTALHTLLRFQDAEDELSAFAQELVRRHVERIKAIRIEKEERLRTVETARPKELPSGDMTGVTEGNTVETLLIAQHLSHEVNLLHELLALQMVSEFMQATHEAAVLAVTAIQQTDDSIGAEVLTPSLVQNIAIAEQYVKLMSPARSIVDWIGIGESKGPYQLTEAAIRSVNLTFSAAQKKLTVHFGDAPSGVDAIARNRQWSTFYAAAYLAWAVNDINRKLRAVPATLTDADILSFGIAHYKGAFNMLKNYRREIAGGANRTHYNISWNMVQNEIARTEWGGDATRPELVEMVNYVRLVLGLNPLPIEGQDVLTADPAVI